MIWAPTIPNNQQTIEALRRLSAWCKARETADAAAAETLELAARFDDLEVRFDSLEADGILAAVQRARIQEAEAISALRESIQRQNDRQPGCVP